MQRRSAPLVLKAKALVDEGVLGKISLIRPMWKWNVSRELNNAPLPGKLDWQRFLGAARQRPLEPRRFRYWRFFWDYGGGAMTDAGTHLMDVAQWFAGVSGPLAAVCCGQINKLAGAETPDVFCAVFEYPRHLATWTLDYCNSFQNGWFIEFQGDAGTLIMDQTSVRLYKEPWTRPENREPAVQVAGNLPVEPHVQNFLDCIRSRKEPNAPIEVGAEAVFGPHLANIAFLQGRKVAAAALSQSR
jgi:predicted dehydrogenase